MSVCNNSSRTHTKRRYERVAEDVDCCCCSPDDQIDIKIESKSALNHFGLCSSLFVCLFVCLLTLLLFRLAVGTDTETAVTNERRRNLQDTAIVSTDWITRCSMSSVFCSIKVEENLFTFFIRSLFSSRAEDSGKFSPPFFSPSK